MQKYELRKRINEEEALVRFETEMAEQMQVDGIEFSKDNLLAFVATLGYSRPSYVEEEQPHLLSLPQPYKGIHPKVVIQSVAKKSTRDNKTLQSRLYIPNRDLQENDDFISAIMVLSSPLSLCGGVLWS